MHRGQARLEPHRATKGRASLEGLAVTNHSQLKSVCLGLAVAGLLAGCAQSGAPAMGAGGGMVADARSAPAGGSRAVEILRLPYGVPRVVAADHEGLGFGAGYAAAEDNACLLMDRAMTGRGERAAFLGAGEDEANVASDAYHRRIRQSGAVEVLLSGDPAAVDTPGEDARAFVRGYAAGVNRVLADGGVRDPACAGKAWVRNLTDEDIWYAALTPPFGQPIDAVTSARPPAPGGATTSAARVEDMLADRQGMGSNAYGFGSDATRDGVDAVLLGNPHYPWDGALRFYRIGLTIPGELNVVGAGLVTSPLRGNRPHQEHRLDAHRLDGAAVRLLRADARSRGPDPIHSRRRKPRDDADPDFGRRARAGRQHRLRHEDDLGHRIRAGRGHRAAALDGEDGLRLCRAEHRRA